MKQLILSGMFVVCGLSVSLASEKWAVDSINWHRAEQKMQEKDFQDAALTYKELITKGDSLFVDYAAGMLRICVNNIPSTSWIYKTECSKRKYGNWCLSPFYVWSFCYS